jgi:hypothetical protein
MTPLFLPQEKDLLFLRQEKDLRDRGTDAPFTAFRQRRTCRELYVTKLRIHERSTDTTDRTLIM